jgi:hypothetical protein
VNRQFTPIQDQQVTDIESGFEDARADVPGVAGENVPFLAQRQHAAASFMFSKNAGFKAKADITNGGLISIAALVSSILLSTAVLVHVAVRDGKRRRLPW